MTVSQPPSAGTPVRPRAAWYLLVVVLWVASGVVFGTAAVSTARVIDDGLTSVQASQLIPVSSSGVTIYSRTKPATRDCFLRSSSGQTFSMNGLSFDLSTTIDNTTVHALATSPNGLSPGEYRVSCPGAGSRLYFGDKLPLGSILARFGISVLLGLAGLVVLIVLLVRRHTSKSRIRTQQLMSAQGHVGGWPASSPYGQPGQFQPYQPPPGYGPPQGQPQPYQPPPYQPQPDQPQADQTYPDQPQPGYDAPPPPDNDRPG